ncbi:MAG: orotate phosphoribosyltransferase [Candidatus Altiarchaeota archaeon]|nr:orotate phosphoribosyltransferase [Candidatus Altiarchaeota archaeon]
MDATGLCDNCGKSGRLYTCMLCGRRVCADCIDAGKRACKNCKGGRTTGGTTTLR